MTTLVPISLERHGKRRWLRSRNFAFAARLPLVPLSATEILKACTLVPIAFVKNGDAWVVSAVLGLPPDSNLCVLPDGSWIGPYVPALLRAYPFSIHKAGPGGQLVLCIDEARGLAPDAATQAEPFYGADQQPAPLVAQTLKFMTQWYMGRLALDKALAALDQHKLIVPWDFNVNQADKAQTLGGLYRIDTVALGVLPAPALEELMKAGALTVAYAQTISTQHLSQLGAWAQLHAKGAGVQTSRAAAVPAGVPEPAGAFQVPPELATADGELNLDFLRAR